MICLDVIFFVFSFCLGFAEFKSGLVSLISFSKDWAIISSDTALALSWGLSWVLHATLLVTVLKPPTCVNSGKHSVHSSWFVLCLTWWSFTLSMVGFLVLSKKTQGDLMKISVPLPLLENSASQFLSPEPLDLWEFVFLSSVKRLCSVENPSGCVQSAVCLCAECWGCHRGCLVFSALSCVLFSFLVYD